MKKFKFFTLFLLFLLCCSFAFSSCEKNNEEIDPAPDDKAGAHMIDMLYPLGKKQTSSDGKHYFCVEKVDSMVDGDRWVVTVDFDTDIPTEELRFSEVSLSYAIYGTVSQKTNFYREPTKESNATFTLEDSRLVIDCRSYIITTDIAGNTEKRPILLYADFSFYFTVRPVGFAWRHEIEAKDYL